MELTRSSLIVGTVLAVGLGAAAAWWTRPPPDQPGKPVPPSAADAASSQAAAPAKPAKLYKWQNDEGVWNYTDHPPAGRAYEEVRGTPNVTSVPTVVPEVPRPPTPEDSIPPPTPD